MSWAESQRGSGTFHELIESAPDGIVVVNEHGSIVLVNLEAERLFAYPRDEIIGHTLEHLVPERYRDSHAVHRAHFTRDRRLRPMGTGLPLFGRRRDGSEFPIEVSISPLTTDAGPLVAAHVRDLSERRQRETELQHARALAEEASSAKSDFLASMSHELRTPLNAILGFTQLLQRDRKTPLSDRQQERIDHVMRAGEHLLRLIDEVLDLASVEAGRVSVSLEPVGLYELLSEVKATLDPMASRANIAVSLDTLAADCPSVIADRTRLRQILLNLGSNAIKYGREGGHVTLRVARDEGRVRVTVADDGLGISAQQQPKIFQPFQRAGQETGPIEGTGIGLAISKRLSELMQGQLGFSSVEGQGSEFWIVLSQAPSADRVEDVVPRSTIKSVVDTSRPSDAPRSLIVYIEDNPSNIAFMKDLIADFDGVELLAVPTAEIGLALVRARRPQVVIMDINLPGIDGFQATQQLRNWPETQNIPVIALSAAAMVRDANQVQRAGFYRYLTKPVKVDELTETLERLLRSTRAQVQ